MYLNSLPSTVLGDSLNSRQTPSSTRISLKGLFLNIFPEWDKLKVLGTKVMKYEVGDFVAEHRDRVGMLHSDCYEKGLNLKSKDLMIIPLNNNYEGGILTVEGEPVMQTVGSVIQVKQPGNNPELRAVHGVSEVTKGTRYSLVFWNFQ
mgnify:CR=1 FL=1